jgi:phage terminase large subunit-like protein
VTTAAGQTEHPLATLARMSPEGRRLVAERLRVSVARHDAMHRFAMRYPDTGPLRRELYQKHTEFFAAGAQHQERALIGANRSGKTSAASYEITAHLTGLYPDWWVGRRFTRPIIAWAAGEDAKTVRETIQPALFGALGEPGTGMIPRELIASTTRRSGVAEAIDSATVKHASGGTSRIVLKSYDQGRESFQGAKIDVGWLDEEAPLPVYTETLTRTMATVPGEHSGILLCTFTPLKGLSGVVLLYLPGGRPA